MLLKTLYGIYVLYVNPYKIFIIDGKNFAFPEESQGMFLFLGKTAMKYIMFDSIYIIF